MLTNIYKERINQYNNAALPKVSENYSKEEKETPLKEEVKTVVKIIKKREHNMTLDELRELEINILSPKIKEPSLKNYIDSLRNYKEINYFDNNLSKGL